MGGVPAWAHYRPATDARRACRTCDFFSADGSRCEMFDNAPVDPGYVCDKWANRIDKGDHDPMFRGEPTDRFNDLSEQDKILLSLASDQLEPSQVLQKADTKAAGIAVRAADTGRVLMIQRSLDARDRAAGTWEFPGGKLNDGEHPRQGAQREWQEEMGMRLPRGRHAGQWRSGVYQGFVHEVPNEDCVRINADADARRVRNPDDPDGDQIEVAAWVHPRHMRRNSSVRAELRDSRAWRHVEKSLDEDPFSGTLGHSGLSQAILKMPAIAAPGVPPYEPKVVKDRPGTLYLISHAKTRYNSPGQPHADRVQGWLNVPLDSQGRGQAAKLAQFLGDRGVQVIHASDLARSAQTAQIIGHALGLKPVLSARYRPWNLGHWAGHSSADAVPKLKQYMTKNPDTPVDGGESFNSFQGRFIPALEALLKQVEGGRTVALVAHSRNIELAQGWLEGRGPRSQVDTREITADKIDPATVFAVQHVGGKWQMRELADETGWVRKAHAPLHLRVAGMSRAPGGMTVYRMQTRDGHYVGRTLPTRIRARKGDALTISPTAWSQDAQTDLHWINPVVASSYRDAPHSWRELQALAGAHLEKDYAPGAEVAPATADQGVITTFPSGPTLSAVHVTVPLPDISQAYTMKLPKGIRQRRGQERAQLDGEDESIRGNRDVLVGAFLPVQKADRMKQIVYGVVLEPNVMDSQDDFMLPKHVEATAHTYLKKAIRGQSSVVKLQHRLQGFRRNKPSIVPVESFIAPVDFPLDNGDMVRKGSWVMAMHVEDPDLWQDFLNGKYEAFSVGGTGVRQAMNVPQRPSQAPFGYVGNPQPSEWGSPRPTAGQLGSFM